MNYEQASGCQIAFEFDMMFSRSVIKDLEAQQKANGQAEEVVANIAARNQLQQRVEELSVVIREIRDASVRTAANREVGKPPGSEIARALMAPKEGVSLKKPVEANVVEAKVAKVVEAKVAKEIEAKVAKGIVFDIRRDGAGRALQLIAQKEGEPQIKFDIRRDGAGRAVQLIAKG